MPVSDTASSTAAATTLSRPLFVIGDLHANYDACVAILRGLELVDRGLAWQAPNVDVVQLGDVCDRGPNSRDIYELFMRLQQEASAAGSSFEVLIGNHEVMNAFGMEQYTTEQEAAGYARNSGGSGWNERRAAFAPGGFVFEWLAERPVLHRVGPIVCGHGDLPMELREAQLEHLDRAFRAEFVRQAPAAGVRPRELPALLFSGQLSVLWSRQAKDGGPQYGASLHEFLRRNGACVYVCGHTPQPEGQFKQRYAGAYLCIDTAMGFEASGVGARTALVIRPDTGAEQWSFGRGRGGSRAGSRVRRRTIELPLEWNSESGN